MTRREMVLIGMMFVGLWIGMEAGYRIARSGEGHRLDAAYQGGFTACQEQF